MNRPQSNSGKRNKYKAILIITTIFLIISVVSVIFVGTHVVNENLKRYYNSDLKLYEKTLKLYDDTYLNYSKNAKYAALYNDSGTLPVNVSINTLRINDERIGNEISFQYIINGEQIHNGSAINISTRSRTEIYSYVQDDEKYPDIGYVSDSVLISLEELTEGFEFSHQMSAHETNGKFAGNTAIYEVTYKFIISPVFLENVSISKSDFSVKPKMFLINESELIGDNRMVTIILILIVAICVATIAYSRAKIVIEDQAKIAALNEEQAYSNGQNRGHKLGLAEGLEQGYAHGYKDGQNKGYSQGRKDGLLEGCNRGYQEGYEHASIMIRMTKNIDEKDMVVPTEPEHYVANNGSKKFHRPDCQHVSTERNSGETYFSSRYEAILSGYSPCKICKP